MTNAIDTKASAAVTKIMEKLGRTVTFNVVSNKTHAVDGSVTRSETATPVTSSPLLQYNDRQIDGDQVQRGDSYIVVGYGVVIPENASTVTIDGVTWRIVTVKPIASGDDVAVYIVQLRK